MKKMLILYAMIFLTFHSYDVWGLPKADDLNYSESPSSETPEQIAKYLFQQFKNQKVDNDISSYYLSKNSTEKQVSLIRKEQLNKMISYDYDSLVSYFKHDFDYQIRLALEHDVDFSTLNSNSIEIQYIKSSIFNKRYKDKLLVIKIHCSDKKQKYVLTIAPLINENENWRLFLTEFHLTIE